MGLLQKALFSKTLIPATTKSLQASDLRARAISNNIANVSTPGYKRRDVEFEDMLKNSLSSYKLSGKRTSPKHINVGKSRINSLKPEIDIVDENVPFSGKNNVDIDKEVAAMADNQMLHNFDVKFLSYQYGMFKEAITGNVR